MISIPTIGPWAPNKALAEGHFKPFLERLAASDASVLTEQFTFLLEHVAPGRCTIPCSLCGRYRRVRDVLLSPFQEREKELPQ